MASANKQHKRAQRAKTKAKQNRAKRTAPTSELELDPNDSRIDFESVDLTELFVKMRDAEKTSLQAMCTVFLSDPLLELVYEQEGDEGATDFILAVLIEYRNWSTEADEAAALEWIESEAFRNDYMAASQALFSTRD
ncbi:hypothetical protein CW358_17880 [Pseudomonas protegens]|uniref:hypothetical protein n=1 Tax=Pseudomonas protegens TaxID=380021 RepID=UPI0010118A96|nr:hypothetical protein [Pseudomonas protegens]RXU64634.1 hypothetical protein CW358_17880 [Pseudomonas protegens]